MSEWERLRLAKVALVGPKDPPLPDSAPFITMADVGEWGQWAEPSGVRGNRGGVRAQGGDVLFARITPCLENGKIAKVPPELGPVGGSTEFVVIRATDRVLSDFLFLWATSPQTHQAAIALMTGSTGRQRVSSNDLAALPILVPPLDDQRRIVDLIAAVDGQIAALQEESASAGRALERAALAALSLPTDSGDAPIADLLLRNIGGVWGEAEGESEVDVDVYRSTEFTDWGHLAGPADARRSIKRTQFSSRELRPGDILVEKSGGTPTRPVGRVVRIALGDLSGPAVGANFLQLLRVDPERAVPEYVFWVLWATHRRGDVVIYQQASTNIRNLRTTAYLARTITLPSRTDQERAAEALEAMAETRRRVLGEAAALRAFRSVLLASLLSQAVLIPESYDHLLGAAS